MASRRQRNTLARRDMSGPPYGSASWRLGGGPLGSLAAVRAGADTEVVGLWNLQRDRRCRSRRAGFRGFNWAAWGRALKYPPTVPHPRRSLDLVENGGAEGIPMVGQGPPYGLGTGADD